MKLRSTPIFALLTLAGLAVNLSSLAQTASTSVISGPPSSQPTSLATSRPHNIIIFVADGLRSGIVTQATAPTLADIRRHGVDFQNSHSVYPTVTTVNASAIATGHGIGDTGEYFNNIYLGIPALKSAYNSLIGDMEDDAVLLETNQRNSGNYLNEISFLAAARANGYNTAAIGKEGPVLIQDLAAGDGSSTLIIDDLSGSSIEGHIPLPATLIKAIAQAGLDKRAPDRGLNAGSGAYNMAGTLVANTEQQDWFIKVATKVILPKFSADNRPFALVYWSRDPDGTQHNQGDSLNELTPGINGPTTMAAIKNASDNLQSLIDQLKALGLYETTDIMVTADHGFATISKQSATSAAAKLSFPSDVVQGLLPQGFVAIDLAKSLDLKMWDANGLALDMSVDHPKGGALLGDDPKSADVMVVSGGGSDLIYLNPNKAKDLAPKIISALTKQDYTGALFVDDSLGPIAGALKFSDIGLIGTAKTARPAIYISFRSFSTECPNPEVCAVVVADAALQQGQGTHGSLSRAESHNFMAAIGPDFKSGYLDSSPFSNADIAPTLAHILGLKMPANGHLTGRVAEEALAGGPQAPTSSPVILRSEAASNGFVTILEGQSLGDAHYFDAAGMPGRVVGLKSKN